MTKMNEIKKLKDSDLSSLVSEKRESIRSFRFGTAGRDASAHRIARKDIARALTELQARREKEDTPNA